MIDLPKWFAQFTGLTPETLANIFNSILAFVVLWLLSRLALKFVRRLEDVRAHYAGKKAGDYIFLSIGILVGIQIWLDGLQNLATYLGLLSAGVAIALRDLIVNFVGWAFILISRPFGVGDRIQIGTTAGDVIDLRIFQFTLLEIGNWVDADQSTGRIIHVPNGKIFSEDLANYGSGFQFIWNEIPVMLAMDSDWQTAKCILQEIADKHAQYLGEVAQERVKEATRKFMIYYTNLTPTVYTCVKEKGILLTIRYLCEPRLRRTSADAIWEDILTELGQREDIHLYRSV